MNALDSHKVVAKDDRYDVWNRFMVQHYQICKLNTWNTRIFHEGNVKHRSMCHNQLMRFCLAPLGSALWLHQSWYPGGGGGELKNF